MKILALESSTTSAKAFLYDAAAGTTRVASRRFEHEGDDPARRDPDDVTSQLLALGREHAAGERIDLIVLSNTWHGLTLQDAGERTLSPVLEWPYAGARGVSARMRADADFVRWYYRETGCMVNAIYPSFKLRMLKDEGADLAAGLAMDQGSVLFQRLTGNAWTTQSQASGSGLLSTTTGTWSAEVLAALGIEEARLPEIVDPHTTAPLTEPAATLLRIPVGTPVLVASPDGGLSQIGDEATEPGQMTFSMGTSGALRLSTTEPVFSDHQSTWAYRSPAGWLSGAATSGCGNTSDWAKEAFFGRGAGFGQIESRLRPGARDVPVFLPFLFGERCPGWQDSRRGGFTELEPFHDAVDLYQSVLQGIVFNLYQCYRELVRINGQPSRIRLSGGVLSSDFWTQLTADVFGVELELSSQQHSSVVGAVRIGLQAVGEGDTSSTAHPGLGAELSTITPDPALRDYYDERFATYLRHYRDGAD